MLPDYNAFLKVIKQASQEAVNSTNPVNVCFGTITSTSPLKILIDQKMTLGSAQLVLTKAADDSLAKGDNVVLLRMQGGQKYIVMDRVV